MKKYIVCFLLSLLIFTFVLMPSDLNVKVSAVGESNNEEFSLTAKSAILIDYDTDTIIYQKNSNQRLPIASMTKLATLAVVFDFLDKGLLKENDLVKVSDYSASIGGSSAFLDAGSSYKVTDLIKSVIVASANDSSVALAEAVAGNEEIFVSKMNKLVESLNLKDTHFENCTGLPSNNHYSSAYDMAKIYKIICNNKLYKSYSKIWIDNFVHPSGRKTELVNTNRLIRTFDGIEGGKTGYTDSAKFCLTASARRSSMRLIAVVIGVGDSKTRFSETSKLLNYGFANYQNKSLVNCEVPVTIQKFKMSKKSVEVYAEKDIVKFLQKGNEKQFTVDFQVNEVKAPISAGTVVGKLFVFDENNMVVDEINLIVKEDVSQIGIKESLKKIVEIW